MIYSTILADPPWYEVGGGRIKRGADRHYPLLKTPAIVETMTDILSGNVADNAHLYLWVTNNFLKDGLTVMDSLGFRYITMITWYKDRIGLGQYFRGRTEHMLFGVKGRLPAKVRTQSTGFMADRSKHSKKPEVAYDIIESVSPPQYFELFARNKRPGWDSWGNEV